MINMEKRTYVLRGTEPLLGTNPANPAVRTQYLAGKMADPADAAGEEGYVPELDEKGLTVFLRDADGDDALMLLDYQVRGFFKSALLALGQQNGVKAPRGKVDKYLFVGPRKIPIIRDGKRLLEEDDVCERPLRASTMRGDRVTVAGSESVNTPWAITIELTLIPNAGSKTSRALTWEAVEDALDYGTLCGLGQFRTGSYGRFTWERVDKPVEQPNRPKARAKGA